MADPRTIEKTERLRFIKAIGDYSPLLSNRYIKNEEFYDLICAECGWSTLGSQEKQIIFALRKYINTEIS